MAAAVEGLEGGKGKRRKYPMDLRQRLVEFVRAQRALFLFVSKNRKRAKVLYFDGTGLCLFAKRLDKGHFAAVADRDRSRSVKLTLSELTQFIEGSGWIGRSPALLTWADLTPRWPEPEKK